MSSPYSLIIENYTAGKFAILPVTPAEIPEVSRASKVDAVSTLSGAYTVIGQPEMQTTSVEALLPKPSKKLSFVMSKNSFRDVDAVISYSQEERDPIWYTVATDSGGYVIRDLFAVTSYTYKMDKKEDYVVTFELTRWAEYPNWDRLGDSTAIREVRLNAKRITVTEGTTRVLELMNASGRTTWRTSNSSIAVCDDGIVRGKRRGTCTITATNAGKKYTCKVTVEPEIVSIL